MESVLKFLIRLQASEGNVLNVARQPTARLDAISQKAQGVGASLRRAFSFEGLKSSFMSIPGMQFLTNPYTLVAGAIGAIIKIGASAEQTSVAFTTLVGSETKAKSMLDEIAKFASASPFGKLDLTENAKTMLNFGVETGRVLPLLKRLGDISGGNKSKLQSLSLVLGQVSAAGKLQGQDNLQFINAGFNPLQELMKMTGKSYAELQDMMSKGQITFENVVQAISHATGEGGKFFGMMNAQSQTVAGKFSTIGDEVIKTAVGIYKKLQPVILKVLDIAMSVVEKISAELPKVIDIIGKVVGFLSNFKLELLLLSGVVGVAMLTVKAYSIGLAIYAGVVGTVSTVTKAWAGVQALLNTVLSLNPIGLVIIGVAALTAVVVACWNRFAGFRAFMLTMWETMKGFGNIIKDFVIDRLQSLLSGLGKVGQALSKLFSGDFKGAWQGALEGVKDISGITAAEKAFNSTKSLVSGVKTSYDANYSKENSKDKAGKSSERAEIKTPQTKGSKTESVIFGAGNDKGRKGRGGKTAEALATGGTRNTSITMNISKFFDNINVTMADKTDTAELERIVLRSMNRALAIATSTER